MATSLEYLYQLLSPDTLDPATHQPLLLYQFTKATEFSSPVSLPSATYAVPNVHGGLNPRGRRANLIAPRTLTQKFVHVYNQADSNDTWVGVRDALWKAAGNKRVQLQLLEPDGSSRINYGALTAFPIEGKPEDRIFSTFELTFALENAFWKSLNQIGSPIRYDTGLQYDSGLTYDGGNTLGLNAASQSTTLTNGGDAPEYEPKIAILGPYSTPITIANLSIVYPGGDAMQMIYSGPTIVGASDGLLIDVQSRQVLRGGVTDYGNFSWGKNGNGVAFGQTEWFRLDPGANVVQVSHPGYSINSYTVTNGGSGYTGVPTVVISGGGGSGATAGASVSGGVVTAVNVFTYGSGYTGTPTVTISGGNGTGATATANVSAVGANVAGTAVFEAYSAYI
jgi:hypothetical protein